MKTAPEGQLRGTPDDVRRLPRVLHPGQLDDDPLLSRTGEGGLCHPQRVHPQAKHLERPVRRLGVGPYGRRVLGLEDDLGAAAQVETEYVRVRIWALSGAERVGARLPCRLGPGKAA